MAKQFETKLEKDRALKKFLDERESLIKNSPNPKKRKESLIMAFNRRYSEGKFGKDKDYPSYPKSKKGGKIKSKYNKGGDVRSSKYKL